MSRGYGRRDFGRDNDRFDRGRGGRGYDDFRGPPRRGGGADFGGGMGGGGSDFGGGMGGPPGDGAGRYGGESLIGGAGKRMHRIIGTEEDKVNCSFYFKIGACRHGERCSRLHMKPNFSQTLLLAHFYMPPPDATAASEEEKKRKEMIGINAYNNKPMPHGVKTDNFSNMGQADEEMDESKRQQKEKRERELEEHYIDFYEDVINEMIKYGDVEDLLVCENSGDHMYGNTYVKFSSEEQAAQALLNLRGRYYCGRIIQADFSPVTDFREGRCRQFDERNCSRGPYCNFLHLRPVPKFARRYLRRTRLKARYEYGKANERRQRRHKMRLNGLNAINGLEGINVEDSDDTSLSDESDYERRWRTFPMRGNSQERRNCIKQWNEMLDERRERKAKKKAAKAAKMQTNAPIQQQAQQVQLQQPQQQQILPPPQDKMNSNSNSNSSSNSNNNNNNGSSTSNVNENNNSNAAQDVEMSDAVKKLNEKPPQTENAAAGRPFMNPERLAMLGRN